MSSSKRVTETTNLTEITDSRVVGGEGSVNLSANDSRVSMVMTDHGAVSGGLGLGSQAVTAAAKMAADTNKTGASMFAGALDFAGKNNSQAFAFAGDGLDFASSNNRQAFGFAGDAMSQAVGAISAANSQLADAYQSGNAGDQTQLKYAGFIVVGLAVAAFAVSKIK